MASSLKTDCTVSSYEEADDAPTYFNVANELKEKELTLSDSMYAVIDKDMKSEDSTYDKLNKVMENDEDKKSLSESLCDKRFLCLLVAIIVTIVTSCACFLLAFLQISQLRSETASLQVCINIKD